jgi:hypothetical protein
LTESKAYPSITLVHDSAEERETKRQLLDLLARYPLDRWFYTDAVRIEDGVIPHSHPVLTLNSAHSAGHPLRLLSVYIHEQLHWYYLLESHGQRSDAALDLLHAMFPGLPVDFPAGCRTEYSTYLHIPINFWELLALEELIGRDEATAYIGRKPMYTAVYALVVKERTRIQEVLAELDLMPPELPPADKRFKVGRPMA